MSPNMNKIVKLVSAICMLSLFCESSVFAADARTNFKACAICHGANGEGRKTLAPPLKGNKFVATAPIAEIEDVIRNGLGVNEKKYKEYLPPMPANNNLTEDEIKALVKYMKEVILAPPADARISE